MSPLVRPAAAAALLATWLLAPCPAALAQDAEPDLELQMQRASARFAVHPRTGARRDVLNVIGRFPDIPTLRNFDPEVDTLSVTVSGWTLVLAEPPPEEREFRIWRRRGEVRRWRYRLRGEAGSVGLRILTVNARSGIFRFTIRKADLRPLRNLGAADVTVRLAIGETEGGATFSFFVARTLAPVLWRYRNTGEPPPGPAPGPVTFTRLLRGTVANRPLPTVLVARSQQELEAMWATLGNPGALPQADFSQDMIVAVTALVQGPGQYLPYLTIADVRGAGTGIVVDWYLSGCEWGLCPGAPIPCPTVTPFSVVRTQRSTGPIQDVQGPTLGVCP